MRGHRGQRSEELAFTKGLATLAKVRQLGLLVAEPDPEPAVIRRAVELLPEVSETLEALLATLAGQHPAPPADGRPERYHRLLCHEVRNRANLVGLALAQWESRANADGGSDGDGPLIAAARLALDSLTEVVADPALLRSNDGGRPGSGRLRPLAEVVDQVIALAHPVAAGKGAEVAVEGLLPGRPVDRLGLELVLFNLVLNAIDHTDAAKPRRWIRLGGEQNDGGRLVLRVADNGTGMPQELADRVFDDGFERPGGDSPGRGLGLAIVRQTMERMGGRVWLESLPEQGTTVWLDLGVPRPTP